MPVAKIHVRERQYDEARLGKVSAPDDLLITLYEVAGENISFGRGLAQRAHISDKTPEVA